MKTTRTFSALALVVAAFLCSSNLQAQTVNAGAWMIGGDAGFSSASYDGVDDALTTISLNPNIGYFIMDNLGVGLRLGVESQTQGDNGLTIFSVGPFARYYVWQGLFPQVGFNYNSVKVKDGGDATTSTDIDIAVGYSLFLNNSIALEPALYYNIGDGVNTFGLRIGVQGFLGRN
ncbi:MAG: outer membrane beta-barrel protein [Chitinophagaceae bacterium]|jgi:outer membrane protein|nr:outer membrane beta-barrel protein [Saprospiraceae bacterium]MBP9933077.1 outer membrane beta-barrel protein [Chitinophagaceae bacterium]